MAGDVGINVQNAAADKDMRIVGTFGITGHTERKRMEEEIHKFNVGLEELVTSGRSRCGRRWPLDATDDGAFIFDPETLRHSYVNEGAVGSLATRARSCSA